MKNGNPKGQVSVSWRPAVPCALINLFMKKRMRRDYHFITSSGIDLTLYRTRKSHMHLQLSALL